MPTPRANAADPLARVGVVVVTYDSAGTLDACLAALPVVRLAGVVVVDSASPTGPPPIAQPGIRRIARSRNEGFGAAANAGAAELPGAELLCVLNPDAVLTADALEALVGYLDTHPRCALVGPRVVGSGGSAQPSSGDVATLRTELRYAVPRRLIGLTRDRRHAPEPRRSGPVGYVEGACLLVRVDAFRAVGRFDPGYFLFFEELDLAERLRAAGHTVDLCAEATVRHLGGASRATVPFAARTYYVASTVRYLRRHRGSAAAHTYRMLAGAWWWLAGRTGRLEPAATRAWRAALHMPPPPPPQQNLDRVLFVVVESPWPALTGGRRRLAALATALDAETDLTVLAAVREPADAAPPPGLTVRVAHRSDARWRSLARLPGALATGAPLFTVFYRRRSARTALRRLLVLTEPAVVVTHELGGWTICAGVPDPARTVLDLHNYEPDLFAAMPGLRWRIDAPRLRRWARRQLPRYGAVTVVSDADRDAYAALAPDARIVVAPNGADLPATPRPDAATPRPDPGGRRLLVLGDLGYPPNAHGLRFLLDEVLPRLAAAVTVRVVGRGPVPTHPAVDAAGVVDDLAAEWAAATVLVVPVRTGGGSRLKVLEAFAAGVPVVATTVGIAGLAGLVPGEHALVADDPAAFADAVEVALTDADRRAALARAGRALLIERYEWSRTTAPFVTAVRSLAQESRRQAAE